MIVLEIQIKLYPFERLVKPFTNPCYKKQDSKGCASSLLTKHILAGLKAINNNIFYGHRNISLVVCSHTNG